MSYFRIAGALALAAIVIAAEAPASAHDVTVGSLTVTDLWTPAPPPGAPTAAGYLTITNNGTEPDTLVGATSPLAETGMLHRMEVTGGVMSMTPVDDGIEIPAGRTVTLAPGGFHIMFVTLKGALKDGDRLPVTLTFAKAGSIDTFLHVMPIGATSMDGSAMGSMESMHSTHGDAMAPAGDGGQ